MYLFDGLYALQSSLTSSAEHSQQLQSSIQLIKSERDDLVSELSHLRSDYDQLVTQHQLLLTQSTVEQRNQEDIEANDSVKTDSAIVDDSKSSTLFNAYSATQRVSKEMQSYVQSDENKRKAMERTRAYDVPRDRDSGVERYTGSSETDEKQRYSMDYLSLQLETIKRLAERIIDDK